MKKPWNRKWARRLLAMITAMAAMTAGLVATAAPAAADGPTLVPLITFFSQSRGDHFTTTQPVWTCQYHNTCADDPGYEVVGMQGFVFNPANPQPPNTRPLYHWWNPTRGDNWLTTDPRWSGEVGDRQNSGGEYVLFRIEGYVPTTWSSGAVALRSYWNPTTADNAALATWRSDIVVPSGWTQYRFEGYLLPPISTPLNDCRNNAAHDFRDNPEWNAQGNLVNTWSAPLGLVNGDALKVQADPDSVIRTDYWGNQASVFGQPGDQAPGGPAPERPWYSLIGRVTSGAVFVHGSGWYEANDWFPVVGTENSSGDPSPSPCLLYRSLGGSGQDFQLSFNDSNLGDNGGFAPVTVTQWF